MAGVVGQGTVPRYTTGHQATPTCECWRSPPAAVSNIGWLRWLCGHHCPVARKALLSVPPPRPPGHVGLVFHLTKPKGGWVALLPQRATQE